MGIWIRLGRWLSHARPAQTVAHASIPDWVEGPRVDEDRPLGCGWFDSSLDLQLGLAVIEHQGIDLGLALDLMLMPPLAGRH